ncbi:MAG: Txe/YoeB family addiction module toxin [Bacteroidetes bacterium]|nr:Txe/YoeB family addiction module toxin [Bacteroidota bacterium]
MRKVKFTRLAYSQLEEWKKGNKKTYDRIERLIDTIQENPYEGIGKPERLKHDLAGHWSRRITKEHRLVYKITDDVIIVISCKYHY